MIFEKQNYDLIVGSMPTWWKKVRYIFDGWNDAQKQNKFHNSLSFFASETYAGHVAPVSQISQAIINIVCRGSIVPIKNILKTISNIDPHSEHLEPPIGTIVDITYNQEMANIEEIENFIKNSGIDLRRADPFIKPHKTLWQLIKEKI